MASTKRKNAAVKEKNTKRKMDFKIVLTSLLFVLVAACCLVVFAAMRMHRSAEAMNRTFQIDDEKSNAKVVGNDEAKPSKENLIAEGIKLGDYHLGGMNFSQAAAALREDEEKILAKFDVLTLKFGPDSIKKTPYEMGLRLDVQEIINEAQEQTKRYIGRKEILEEKYFIDEQAFTEALNKIEKEINQEGKDAYATGFDYTTLTFTFEKEQEGRTLDRADAEKKINEALEKRSFDRPLEIKVERTPPGRTAEELSAFLGHVASASTPIMDWSEDRNGNIHVAAERIGGRVLNPGETFSFHEAIGPMTEENGFFPSGIQDEFGNTQVGVGGGLCQASTTLYQAALRANLQIGEHHFHTQPITYSGIGTDAMVSGWADLTFTNVSDYPYAITAYFDGATLQFDFYGPPNPDGAFIDLYVEELDSEEVDEDPTYEIDEKLNPGESYVKVGPRPNRHVKVYRNTYINGALVNSELMYDHIYPGTAGIIAVRTIPPKGSNGGQGGNATEATTTASQAAETEAYTEYTTEPTAYPSVYVDPNAGNNQPVFVP